MAQDRETKAITGSGFEKKGGYGTGKTPVAKLPKVSTGPAPGAKASDSDRT